MAKKIIVACGGTGGHSFPGLAVAKNLAARGHYVIVWSSGRAIEKAVMKYWTGPMFATGAKPLSAKNAPANLFSILRCRRQMRLERPDALLAMGSYSSLPPVMAARACKVPIALHEANRYGENRDRQIASAAPESWFLRSTFVMDPLLLRVFT